MRIGILQLSDIHIKGTADRVLQRTDAIVATVNAQGEPLDLCLLAVSGDIAFSGASTEYELANDFLTATLAKLRGHALVKRAELVAVPGNHDCDFAEANEPRDLILQQIRSNPGRAFANSTIAQCTAIQNPFFRFLAQLEGRNYIEAGSDRLNYVRDFDVSGTRIRVDCYNTAWTSTLKEQQGALVFPSLGHEPSLSSNDLVIALFHHPYNWLASDNARQFRKYVEARSDLVLTGHEHETDAYQRRGLTTANVSEYIEGGALQPHGGSADSDFNLVVVNFVAKKKLVVQYAWAKDMYRKKSASPWLDLTRARSAFKSPILPTHDFETFLEDCDAPFTHPSKTKLSLSDLFVIPDFREVDPDISDDSKPSAIVQGTEVIATIFEHKRLVIHAAEGAGKTGFAKVLCTEALRRGYVVLFTTARDYDSLADADSRRESRISEQYGEGELERFEQLGAEQRMLVIDDLHRAKINAAEKAKLLKSLESRFALIVILGDDILRVEELAGSRADDNPLLSYRHFAMLELGYELRERLIEKWLDIGQEQPESSDRVRQIANRRREVDAVLGRTLVPSYPIFILIILQQLEANTQLPTVAGSYGYLYEALITQTLASASTDDLDTYYGYLAELAWHLFTANKRRITQTDFEAQHARYVAQYAVKLSFHRIREELLESGILYETNGSYGFKYRYVFYYFVARFLRDNDELRRQTVDRLSGELFREEYANIIIFLCYLSKDPVVIKRLLDGARALFADVGATDFENSMPVWRELQAAKAVLELPDTSPRENRSKALAEMDSARPIPQTEDDGAISDDLAAREKSDFDDVVRINVAMKTLQILGQVLRNFPGSLKADLKYEIANECYMLGLRAISRMFKIMESNLAPLLDEIMRNMRERHFSEVEILARAKKTVFALGELLALVFIKQIANSVGLEKLSKTYDQVRAENDTIAVCLVDAAIRLEHFDRFPEEEIRNLAKRTHKLPFPYGLLRVLVYENFFLYPSEYKLRQSICALLSISERKARGPGLLKE